MKRIHLTLLFSVVLFFSHATCQTLELREISNIVYQTDYTSIADRNKDDLFPKGNTVGFVHFYRGVSFLRQGMYPEAITDFKKALDDSTVSRPLCNLYLGIAFMQLNMPDSILTMYSKAMKVPVSELKKAEFWENTPYVKENTYGSYLMGTNEAIHTPQDTALIDALFGYSTKDKDFYDAFYNYGVYCFNLARYAKSINQFLRVREIDKKADSLVLLNMGYMYRLSGDYKQAMNAYNMLLAKIPRHASACNNRGCLYAFMEKYPKSISDLSKAIHKNARLLVPYCNRGIVYLKMEWFDRALEDFNTAIQVQPDFGDAYYYRGFAKKASGDLQGSVADFSRALELKNRTASTQTDKKAVDPVNSPSKQTVRKNTR